MLVTFGFNFLTIAFDEMALADGVTPREALILMCLYGVGLCLSWVVIWGSANAYKGNIYWPALAKFAFILAVLRTVMNHT